MKVIEVAESLYNPCTNLVIKRKKGGPQEMPWPEEGHLQHLAHRAGSSTW